MNYSELVDSYIKMSGLSLAEIAKRMQEEKGIKIDRSYISKLRNDPKYPATEDINRALAEITGGDPETLIMAGYYEKAPEEVKKTIEKASFFDRFFEYIKSNKPIRVIEQNLDKFTPEELEKEIEFLNSPQFLQLLPDKDREEITSMIIDKIPPADMAKLLGLSEEVYEIFSNIPKENLSKAAEQSVPYNPASMLRIPVLGSIRAGIPIDRIEINEGYTLVDPELLRGREGFALRVKGDSMSGDRILEGDIVIVLKQEEVQPSDIAVVAINGDEATLKRVKLHGDMVMLSPSNAAYEPQLLPAKDVSIIGKVVEVKFWPNKGGQ